MNSNKPGCLVLLGFLILVFCILFVNRLMKTTNYQSPPAVPPVATAPSGNPAATQQPAKESQEAVIPGVMPVDIYLNLENQGFTTTKELSSCCSWFSTQGDYPVKLGAEVYGNTPSTFYRVNASVVTTIDKNTKAIALPFFKYLAGLQYTGSDPNYAQTWVAKNIGKKAKTKIGAVTFELGKGQSNGLLFYMYTE